MNLASLSSGKLFESLFFSFFICILAALAATKFAIRTRLLDIPNSEPHKQHKHPVPYSGGIALFLTTLINTLIFREELSKELFGLILAASIIFAFSLADDYISLNWKIKMAGQAAAAFVLVSSGTRTHLFDAPIFSGLFPHTLCMIFDIGLTFFWCVFITNAYNLVDSADGLMLGLSSWCLGFFIIAAMDAGQTELSILCSILLGCCLSLSFFNTYPAILFMGDSGAQTIGFLISAIAIIYNPPELLQGKTWFLPILLLGVPIFDSVMVTISRHRKGLHFYNSGTDHTFHRLMKMGFSQQQASAFMHAACFALEVIGFFAISQSLLTANLIFLAVICLGIAAIFFLENESLWKSIQNFNKRSKELS